MQLGAHTLRLRPREGHELRIESSTLEVSPPAKVRWHRDVEGNSVAIATFNESTRSLKIESQVMIQQYNQQPHDFLVADYAVAYPFRYTDEDAISLSPYMNTSSAPESRLLAGLVDSVWQTGEQIDTFALLLRLNQTIYRTLVYRMREEEGVQTVDESLSGGTGSCRDSAYLFMMAAQRLGFAARFVSGYIYPDSPIAISGSTHAWAEVFLPGAGWKGFDPSTGSIVGDDHIAVAVARLPESVPPVAGSFHGPPGATMTVDVQVIEQPAQ